MKQFPILVIIGMIAMIHSIGLAAPPLGLPPVPVPANNPQTPEKIKLGEKLFNDKRFSLTGEVSCATCHATDKGFTDQLPVSEGINKLTGTRNAPTVINSTYNRTQFWDGREPSLEEQSKQPFVNPVEMGLENHDPILKIVRTDPEYVAAFKTVFGKTGNHITMEEVKLAIASFERTIIAGNSPFDRYYFGGDKTAMNPAAIRGFDVFLNQGRCISCHTIEQTSALFTDHKFHNLGVGFERIAKDVGELAAEFTKAKGMDVDVAVLTKKNVSELGRFAVQVQPANMGAFKTPTLRNLTVTAPYMHDGSHKTLKDVVVFYNNGGIVEKTDPVNDFQSGGIRPLNLTDQQVEDLVAFLEALTSPEYADQSKPKQ